MTRTEWACSPSSRSSRRGHAAAIPASLDFANAAAVPLAGLTALQALRDELHVARGQRIFIAGGAGGFAIQIIAKHLEAQVATTASPRGEALVRQLGTDIVVDYTQERPVEWEAIAEASQLNRLSVKRIATHRPDSSAMLPSTLQ